MRMNKIVKIFIVVLTIIALIFSIWFFTQRTQNLFGQVTKQYRDVKFSKQSLESYKVNNYNTSAWVYGSRGRGNELFFFFLEGNEVQYSKILAQSTECSPLDWGYLENSSDDTVVVCGTFMNTKIDHITIDNIPQDKIQYSSSNEVTKFFSVIKKDKVPIKITGYKGDKAIFKNYPE